MGLILAPFCLAALAWLVARRAFAGIPKVAGATAGGFLFGVIAIVLLFMLLALCNIKTLRQPGGLKKIAGAASEGALLLLPLSVLALLAELLLHWNAAQVFAAAGLMGSAAAMGSAATKRGGGWILNLALPTLAGLALSAVWMLLCALAAHFGAGR